MFMLLPSLQQQLLLLLQLLRSRGSPSFWTSLALGRRSQFSAPLSFLLSLLLLLAKYFLLALQTSLFSGPRKSCALGRIRDTFYLCSDGSGRERSATKRSEALCTFDPYTLQYASTILSFPRREESCICPWAAGTLRHASKAKVAAGAVQEYSLLLCRQSRPLGRTAGSRCRSVAAAIPRTAAATCLCSALSIHCRLIF